MNPLLVGFGQTVCKPLGPRCWECPVVKYCSMKAKNLNPSKASKSRPNVSEKVQELIDLAIEKKNSKKK